MKNLVWATVALLLSGALYAKSSDVRMVTFFPTPYMTYQDLTVKGVCEMGMNTSCSMNVKKDLLTTNMEVRSGKTATLGSNDAGTNITVRTSATPVSHLYSGSGTEGVYNRGLLMFKTNLTVNSIPDPVQSMEASTSTLSQLNLGTGRAFPGCDAANNQISWKRLTIGTKSAVFLACGEGTASPQTCEENGNQEKCCSSATLSNSCKVWNGSACVVKSCSNGTTLNTATCGCDPVNPCNSGYTYYNGYCYNISNYTRTYSVKASQCSTSRSKERNRNWTYTGTKTTCSGGVSASDEPEEGTVCVDPAPVEVGFDCSGTFEYSSNITYGCCKGMTVCGSCSQTGCSECMLLRTESGGYKRCSACRGKYNEYKVEDVVRANF